MKVKKKEWNSEEKERKRQTVKFPLLQSVTPRVPKRVFVGMVNKNVKL